MDPFQSRVSGFSQRTDPYRKLFVDSASMRDRHFADNPANGQNLRRPADPVNQVTWASANRLDFAKNR
jgi:hypothetical protein